MLKVIYLIFVILTSSCFSQTKIEPIYFIGPMIHYNIGANENKFSFTLEASTWLINKEFPIPPSLDFGLEFERKKIRIYSELQTGSLLGLSVGPVFEFSENDPQFGFQTSIWAALLAGVDFRYRRISQTNYYAPGLFFKFPVLLSKINSGF